MADEQEADVVVNVETPNDDENSAAEVATATTAAEATVAAGEAEANADDSEAAAVEAWLSAESAWQAESGAVDAANAVTDMVYMSQDQINELSNIASNLLEAARLQAETQAGQQVSTGVLDDPTTVVDETVMEEPPQSTHWLQKKWFGK